MSSQFAPSIVSFCSICVCLLSIFAFVKNNFALIAVYIFLQVIIYFLPKKNIETFKINNKTIQSFQKNQIFPKKIKIFKSPFMSHGNSKVVSN